MDTLLTLAGYICGLIWRRIRFLACFVLVCTLIAVGIVLFLEPTYRASTLLIPNQSTPSLAASLGELSSLAGQFGINTGTEDPARIFPDILRSRALTHQILSSRVVDQTGAEGGYLDRFDLEGDSEAEKLERATKIFLESRSRIILNPKNSSLKIVVYDHDPVVAATVSNLMAAELDRINQEINRSNARERREFISLRRSEILSELQAHEKELKDFRTANRQYTDSPQLTLEYERLLRRVRIDEEVYLTLTRELELAKIDEVKDVPVINILDSALPATIHHSPRRMLIVITTFLLSFVLGLLLILAWEGRPTFWRAFGASRVSETGA